MRQPTSRVAHLHATDRRHELVAVLERALPSLHETAEEITLYMLVAVFWGLVLYFALSAL